MIWIILATGFCTANFIAIALLFRRLRHDLNRQLSDMRAERNSEWILNALHGGPEVQERSVRAAGGGSHILPLHPRPVRRKKHLGLYRGGAIAAALLALGAFIRCARHSHQAQVVSTALGTTALAATTITVLQVTPWQQPVDTVPPPAPTPAVTMPHSPGGGAGAGSPAAPTAPGQGRRSPTQTADTQAGGSPTPEAEDTAAHPTASPSRLRPTDAALPSVTPPSPAQTAAATPEACVVVLVVHACLAGSG